MPAPQSILIAEPTSEPDPKATGAIEELITRVASRVRWVRVRDGTGEWGDIGRAEAVFTRPALPTWRLSFPVRVAHRLPPLAQITNLSFGFQETERIHPIASVHVQRTDD